MSTPNPLWEIEVAVNRVYPDTRGESEPFLPEERLALPDAIAAFTAGTACVNHLDDETGTLEAGKLADVAVLDRDLFDRGVGASGTLEWSRRSSKGSPSSRTTSRPDGSDRLPEMRRCGRAAHGRMT